MNKLSILKLISTATILAMLLAGLGFSAQPAFAVGGDGSIIIDRAWEDLDMDGLQDFSPVAEPDFPGVTVNLYTCAGDFVSSSVTNVSGNATFKDLFAGDYFVEFVAPAGYAFTLQDQGTNDEIDSDADPLTGRTICFYLAPGAQEKSFDAGFYLLPPEPASLGDFVWEDLNANGVQGVDEPGIPNVQVDLFACDGTPMGTTFTDATGFYSFTGLAAGSYYVQFHAPAGFFFSPQYQGGDPILDSNADAAGMTECVTLVAGQHDPTIDAGLFAKASLGDYVWQDLNANGVQDDGMTGIANVQVELFTCEGVFVASTFTEANGYYLFSGLMPGSYYVQFTSPAGYVFSPQDMGGDDLLDSDADGMGMTACTTLTSGENDLSWDAGLYLQKAAIGDFVWYDANNNGVQDADEVGVPDVLVELYTCSGVIVASQNTGASGAYLFGGLMPGDYYVRFTAPAGYVFSPQDQGGDDLLDSDANPLTGMTICTTLSPGETDLSWDAGLYIMQAPGTGTPGYWKNHPEAWPVEQITIGGVTYTKDEAINWLGQNDKHDKTITMFRSLVSAKLNVLIGNPSSCIADTISAADAWMEANGPVGSGVRANTDAWKVGEPLYLMLDAYNNGFLCAPSRG